MFTGIVTHTARVAESERTTEGMLLRVEKPAEWDDLELGESIAMNGACLTITAIHQHDYECQLIPETLAKTTFGRVVPPRLNLERAMKASDKLGGHFVQGHVDTTGKIVQIDTSQGLVMSVGFPDTYRELVVDKGSIVVDGISLTVAGVKGSVLQVAIIPFTSQHTTISSYKVGDYVNLEFDMIAKHVASILKQRGSHAKS